MEQDAQQVQRAVRGNVRSNRERVQGWVIVWSEGRGEDQEVHRVDRREGRMATGEGAVKQAGREAVRAAVRAAARSYAHPPAHETVLAPVRPPVMATDRPQVRYAAIPAGTELFRTAPPLTLSHHDSANVTTLIVSRLYSYQPLTSQTSVQI